LDRWVGECRAKSPQSTLLGGSQLVGSAVSTSKEPSPARAASCVVAGRARRAPGPSPARAACTLPINCWRRHRSVPMRFVKLWVPVLAPQPAVELLAALRELPGETVATHADAEGETPAAEPVERCRLHGDWTGRRRGSGVTIGPSRTRSVAVATAASVIHGSATCSTGSRQRGWSQTKTPCQRRSGSRARNPHRPRPAADGYLAAATIRDAASVRGS
jgi:hypothetical protein